MKLTSREMAEEANISIYKDAVEDHNAALTAPNKIGKEGKDIRIWMDGAFDMMHFGHMNAFRQGRALGTVT